MSRDFCHDWKTCNLCYWSDSWKFRLYYFRYDSEVCWILRFQTYLQRTPKDEPNIRLVFGFFKGNHNFPERSAKSAIDKFCKRHDFSDHVVKAFDAVWNDFISESNSEFSDYLK